MDKPPDLFVDSHRKPARRALRDRCRVLDCRDRQERADPDPRTAVTTQEE